MRPVFVMAAKCSGSANRNSTVAKQMTVLVVESSAGITAVKAGDEEKKYLRDKSGTCWGCKIGWGP